MDVAKVETQVMAKLRAELRSRGAAPCGRLSIAVEWNEKRTKIECGSSSSEVLNLVDKQHEP